MGMLMLAQSLRSPISKNLYKKVHPATSLAEIAANSSYTRSQTRTSPPHCKALHIIRKIKMSCKIQEPKITKIADLQTSDAKWAALKKIDYIDEAGKARSWEMAERKTRGKAGIDAVAIGNIILHPSKPPSTVLVIQYRPPLDAYTVEWPAGLIDASETVEEAAVRELKEETGYVGTVIERSPTIAADPGLSNANMQLVMVEVQLKEGDKEPEQSLDEGEHIQRITVPLSELYDKLVEYSKQERTVVAAKLFHWAAGMNFSKKYAGKYV